MSRAQSTLPNKRKRPDTDHEQEEKILYDVIRSKEGSGIWSASLVHETKIPNKQLIAKLLKQLIAKGLIKEISNMKNKTQKTYIATGFEPSDELTGGDWYADGKLDTVFIDDLKGKCLMGIKDKAATLKGIWEHVRRLNMVDEKFTTQERIREIMDSLILEKEVVKVKSTGTGEFALIPYGDTCYKCTNKGGIGGGQVKVGALASVPCGVCPRISECSPDGLISPVTCEYFTKWFEF